MNNEEIVNEMDICELCGEAEEYSEMVNIYFDGEDNQPFNVCSDCEARTSDGNTLVFNDEETAREFLKDLKDTRASVGLPSDQFVLLSTQMVFPATPTDPEVTKTLWCVARTPNK